VKAPLSWLREFAELPDDPRRVAAKLGTCGFEVASIEGDVIDVEVTANRPDCLSIVGLAREAAAAFDVALKPLPTPGIARSGQAAVPVSVGDAGCRRYAAAVADVSVGA
jgi:phenylalanyl-tRNA synthetase beta chain